MSGQTHWQACWTIEDNAVQAYGSRQGAGTITWGTNEIQIPYRTYLEPTAITDEPTPAKTIHAYAGRFKAEDPGAGVTGTVFTPSVGSLELRMSRVDATNFNIVLWNGATLGTGATNLAWGSYYDFIWELDGINWRLWIGNPIGTTPELIVAAASLGSTTPARLGHSAASGDTTKKIYIKPFLSRTYDSSGDRPDPSTFSYDQIVPVVGAGAQQGWTDSAPAQTNANKYLNVDDWSTGGTTDGDTTYGGHPGVTNTQYDQTYVTGDPTLSFGGIAFDASDDGATINSISTTVAFTVANGNNRILVVHVAIRHNSSARSVSSITYNGVNLTKLGSVDNGAYTTLRSETWYLTTPATGANNVVITLNGAANHAYTIESYSGVDQTTPFGTYASATGNSAAPSVAVTSAAGERVLDYVAFDNVNGYTVGAGQTERGASGLSGATAIYGVASEEAGAASVTMSWTLTVSGQWATGGAPIKSATVVPSISVVGYARSRCAVAGKGNVLGLLWWDGTTLTYSTRTSEASTNYLDHRAIRNLDPSGAAWGTTALNALEIGVSTIVDPSLANGGRLTVVQAEVLGFTEGFAPQASVSGRRRTGVMLGSANVGVI